MYLASKLCLEPFGHLNLKWFPPEKKFTILQGTNHFEKFLKRYKHGCKLFETVINSLILGDSVFEQIY